MLLDSQSATVTNQMCGYNHSEQMVLNVLSFLRQQTWKGARESGPTDDSSKRSLTSSNSSYSIFSSSNSEVWNI